jgi:stress-induced-phosphoprotein 1
MDVFKELTGIDLMEMQSEQMKNKEKTEDAKKKHEEERKRKEKEEEERKKREAEEALPEEEKQRLAVLKQAEAKKNEGNEFYKKKQFEQALALYSEALQLNENEITYHNNKSACYFEMKDFEKCIAECDIAIEKSKGSNYDYVKLGKAIARKANAKLQQQNYEEAIDLFKTSLLESNDPAVRDQLKKAEKLKKEDDEKKYLDPVKAEEHRLAGNALFEKADFPGAVKEYTEGLRRDPNSKSLYSNRCAAYIKLMEGNYSLKDAEKCVSLDPTFVKGWARKGGAHHLLKEYHKAIQAYEQGLKLDPTNKDCLEGKQRTMMAI